MIPDRIIFVSRGVTFRITKISANECDSGTNCLR